MIYFDNAATTFPKPYSVINEVADCMANYCGNPGRSGHRLSLLCAEKIYDARENTAKLFSSKTPTNVIFTYNCTYALNMAIKALSKRFSHILISDIEHNSVLRPINELKKSGITYDIFTTYPDGDATVKSIRSKCNAHTDMIICSHVSNICGITLPIEKIGRFCKEKNYKFIVDTAQSAGSHGIDIEKINADAICFPGHKGLFGPQGTGGVVFADKYEKEELSDKLSTFCQGGSGINSIDYSMPKTLPERLEAGTLNSPGIIGLNEGIKFVLSNGVDKIFEIECELYNKALEMLSSIPYIELYKPDIKQSSTLLFNVKNISCENIADMLNKNDICVRAGLHCSPLGHKKLGTVDKGAVRASFSPFNTILEVERLYKVIKTEII